VTLDLTAKTTAELRTLKANAEGVIGRGDAKRLKQAQILHDAVVAEFERRGSSARTATGGRFRAASTATHEAVRLLIALAAEAQATFNLSPQPDTAHPHRFASEGGVPKVGGRQRSRRVAADRYLSYKRGTRIVRIGWLRHHDEPVETGGRWYVGLHRADTEGLLEHFEAARVKFLDALGEVAPLAQAPGKPPPVRPVAGAPGCAA
jgi:hypothetical protein